MARHLAMSVFNPPEVVSPSEVPAIWDKYLSTRPPQQPAWVHQYMSASFVKNAGGPLSALYNNHNAVSAAIDGADPSTHWGTDPLTTSPHDQAYESSLFEYYYQQLMLLQMLEQQQQEQQEQQPFLHHHPFALQTPPPSPSSPTDSIPLPPGLEGLLAGEQRSADPAMHMHTQLAEHLQSLHRFPSIWDMPRNVPGESSPGKKNTPASSQLSKKERRPQSSQSLPEQLQEQEQPLSQKQLLTQLQQQQPDLLKELQDEGNDKGRLKSSAQRPSKTTRLKCKAIAQRAIAEAMETGSPEALQALSSLAGQTPYMRSLLRHSLDHFKLDVP